MGVGISAYDMRPADLLELAVAADRAGFDALWLGEHLVLPTGYASEHPTSGGSHEQHHTGPIVGPDTELVDPLVMLAAVAGATRRLRLATGIYLVPLRHPLVTARAAATLQEAAAGRFMLGAGAGWLREEFEALGVPFEERGARLEEAIDVLRAAWRGGTFEHQGRFWQFGPLQISPRPVDVPLVLGGNSERALRRAAATADAWFSSGTPSFDDARHLRDRLSELASKADRAAPLRCYFRIEGCDPGLVARYAADGIDDVVVWADQVWPAGTSEHRHRVLARAAVDLGL